MRWEKCHRCNSHRVGMRKKQMGCMGLLIMTGLALMASFVVPSIIQSLLMIPFTGLFLGPIIFIGIILVWTRHYNKSSKFLYCKDCELIFQPSSTNN